MTTLRPPLQRVPLLSLQHQEGEHRDYGEGVAVSQQLGRRPASGIGAPS